MRVLPPALLRDLALAIGQSGSLDEGFQAALDVICERTGWPIAQAWKRRGSILVCSSAWHGTASALPLRRASESMALAQGDGLPGHAWEATRPVWVNELSASPGFLRVGPANKAGLATGVAVPVGERGEVSAVFEFFMYEPRDQDTRLVNAVSIACEQLNPLIVHKADDEDSAASELNLRALAESIDDPIVCADGDGRIRYINLAAEMRFGLYAIEYVGRPLTILTPERSRKAYERAFKRFIGTRQPRSEAKRIAVVARHANGSEFPLELTLRRVDVGAEVVAVFRDISLSERIETEPHKLQLAHQEFLAKAAHEIRSPVTAIVTGVDVLTERGEDISFDQRTTILQLLKRQAAHLRTLLDDLLDLSQIESRPNLRIRHVELLPIVTEAIDLVSLPENKRIAIEIPSRLTIHADEGRLRQIIINLTENASRYGGSSIFISAFQDHIGVVLSVTDDGPGVSTDFIPQLFRPFTSGSDDGSGSGLGLAIVSELAEAMGGHVWYAPAEPNGARFMVRLPSAPHPAEG